MRIVPKFRFSKSTLAAYILLHKKAIVHGHCGCKHTSPFSKKCPDLNKRHLKPFNATIISFNRLVFIAHPKYFSRTRRDLCIIILEEEKGKRVYTNTHVDQQYGLISLQIKEHKTICKQYLKSIIHLAKGMRNL
jgi:hypothetical protein